MPVNPNLRANQAAPLKWSQMDGNLASLAQLANATETLLNNAQAATGATVAAQVHAQADRVAPADADELLITNSGNSFFLSKLTWKSLKAALSALPGTLNWGNVTGTLATQLDLQAALNLKADSASPIITGPVSVDGSVGASGQVLTSRGVGNPVHWTTPSGGVGSLAWGSITGTLANQTDLNTALGLKADSSSLGTGSAFNVGTAAGNLVQLDGSAKLPAVDGSLLTNLPGSGVASFNARAGTVVLTNADVVGVLGTPLPVLNGGLGATTAAGGRTSLGLGTAATQNVGTAAGNVIQLNGSAKLPAVDGSLLTNLPASAAGVSTFNTRSGIVTLTGTDVVTALGFTPISGLSWGSITGTLSAQSDLNTALGAKAPTANPVFTGTVAGITKSMVGLGNVDNTSDVSKPVSTSQQTALNAKVNLSGSYFDPSWIASLAESKVLPSQVGNAGKLLTTNGSNSSWVNAVSLAGNNLWTGVNMWNAPNVSGNGQIFQRGTAYAPLSGEAFLDYTALFSRVSDLLNVPASTILVTNSVTNAGFYSVESCIKARLFQYANDGEHVGIYTQAYKFGTGATWGHLIEARISGSNYNRQIFGNQIELMSDRPTSTFRGDHVGFHVKYGAHSNATGSGATTYQDAAFMASPWVDGRNWLVAGLALQGNMKNAIQSEANGIVASGYDGDSFMKIYGSGGMFIDLAAGGGQYLYLLRMDSTNPIQTTAALGSYARKIRVRVDNVDFYIPLYT